MDSVISNNKQEAKLSLG